VCPSPTAGTGQWAQLLSNCSRVPARKKMSASSTTTRQALGPTQPPIPGGIQNIPDRHTAHVHPATCNLAHWLTRHGSPTIYKCFALPQMLYRWRHQSRMFCIPPRTMGVGGSFSGVKRPGREAVHSPQCRDEVNQWMKARFQASTFRSR
jgi:hypothetical protein